MLRQNRRDESRAPRAGRHCDFRHVAAHRAVGFQPGDDQVDRRRRVICRAGGDPLDSRHRPSAGLGGLEKTTALQPRRHPACRYCRGPAVRLRVRVHLRRPWTHQRIAHVGIRVPRAAAHRARPAFHGGGRAAWREAVAGRGAGVRRPGPRLRRGFFRRPEHLAWRRVRPHRGAPLGSDHGADSCHEPSQGQRREDVVLPAGGFRAGFAPRVIPPRRTRCNRDQRRWCSPLLRIKP